MRKKTKRSSKNLKINTRIVWTSILAIIIPVIIIASGSSFFISTIASYFNFSSVTSGSYGTVNQIQWNQTVANISGELITTDDNETKISKIKGFVTPLESYNSLVYITCDGEVLYSTSSTDRTMNVAKKILPGIDTKDNTYYFSEKGLVIVDHAQSDVGNYELLIVNDDYIVNDVSKRLSAQNLSNVLLGRTGLIALIIVGLFVLAIVIISFITSRTIVDPIKKIEDGADEIARGNLDYEIDYKSTNELGKTVESFNDMRLRLKESVEATQRSERMRKEMTAGIAHDLRTPLTSIKGYVEGLRDGIASTPQKQKEYLDIIYDATCQTQNMLDDLMTVSKFEIGNVKLEKELINVNDYIEDAAVDIERSVKSSGFDFELINKCTSSAFIEIDGDSFARVFSNIINNSIKYSDKSRKGRIRLYATEYEQNIIFEFEDNGIGVERKDLSRIFDTMYRTDPARSKTSQGSGLGLSVCKQIVELCDGSVWARSHPGDGLSIFISLPKKSDDYEEHTYS